MCHAVLPGEDAVVVTTHDGGFHTALLLKGAGANVVAVVDGRESGSVGEFEEQVRNLAVPVYKGLTVHAAHGKKRIRRIDIGPISGGDSHKSFDCDLLVMAVGFKPQVNLLSMGRKRPEWDAERQILRVTDLPSGMYSTGEVHGSAGFSRLFSEGIKNGKAAGFLDMNPERVKNFRERGYQLLGYGHDVMVFQQALRQGLSQIRGKEN